MGEAEAVEVKISRHICRTNNTNGVQGGIFMLESYNPRLEVSEMLKETDVFERWGEAMGGGYQVVPNLVFLLQNKLGLSSHQVVILLNLSMHWWRKPDLPFVRPSTLAKRMGISCRTVERQLKALCDMGLVQKKALPVSAKTTATTGYDLTGLVERLERMGPKEPKSMKVAVGIERVRTRRAAATLRDMASPSSDSPPELRG